MFKTGCVLAAMVSCLALASAAGADDDRRQTDGTESQKLEAHPGGLHGYIGFHAARPAGKSEYSAGVGFYSAVWPLIDRPLAGFQIGLAGTWLFPNNSDDKNTPLAPEGTLARGWVRRAPTWGDVFQTIEGGLGYWNGNHFHYDSPKFSMNGTPQCYDYEVGSPGWSFFYSNEALPDNRLSIAQLSNRLLIPPDGLPFQGNPRGQFLGYSWMALPFTDAVPGDPKQGEPPTGDQSWTCFLAASNFKGPIAYYIPETWSKLGKLFNDPYLFGRGMDSRPAEAGGGAMEINTVPCFEAQDKQGVTYCKIPQLQFPTDADGRAYLVQDVTYYSKQAIYDAFKAWRDGGQPCSGQLDPRGAVQSRLTTHTIRYDQDKKPVEGVEHVIDTRVFADNVWGVQWIPNKISANGNFPQYFREEGGKRIVIAAADVPAETHLTEQQFPLARKGVPYTSPNSPAWTTPGPASKPMTATLADGSVVTYAWYRFVDQPSFQQYHWSDEKKAKLQAMVEKIHANWPIDREYMAPPTQGKLVMLDQSLIVTPPAGMEVGYVPIVIGQSARAQN